MNRITITKDQLVGLLIVVAMLSFVLGLLFQPVTLPLQIFFDIKDYCNCWSEDVVKNLKF